MEINSETVIVITGASSGIGRAIALALANYKAKIVILARRKNLIDELSKEIRIKGAEVYGIECDVTLKNETESTIDKIIEKYGKIDVLINNAGRGHFGYIEDTTEEQIDNIFKVNVFSLWYTTAKTLQYMRPNNSGHIIHISSIAGKIGFPSNAAYVSAKHAVVGFNRALRCELVGTNINATVVMPAGVLTDWAVNTEGGSMIELFEYESKRGSEIAKAEGIIQPKIPLLRPEEIASKIIECIKNPTPELYTHEGTQQLAINYEQDIVSVEKTLIPSWIANREGYLKIKS